MKHNKNRNVGILFEVLTNGVSKFVVTEEADKAKKLFSIIRKYFMKEGTAIRELYENIYSPVLYGDVNNYYYANKFLKYIIAEYIEYSKHGSQNLNKEINSMLSEIDQHFDRKRLFSSRVPNYKLFASLKCFGDNFTTDNKLSAKDKIICERNVMEHLVNNEELKRIEEGNKIVKSEMNEQQLKDEDLKIIFAMRKFKERYKGSLSEDQFGCLMKFLESSSQKSFNRWAEKKLKVIMEKIENTKDNIEDNTIHEKLNLVSERYSKISKNFIENNIIDLLLSFDLRDNLNSYNN